MMETSVVLSKYMSASYPIKNIFFPIYKPIIITVLTLEEACCSLLDVLFEGCLIISYPWDSRLDLIFWTHYPKLLLSLNLETLIFSMGTGSCRAVLYIKEILLSCL